MESSSSSGSKRRRLMVSYVSLRPDLPATFESLNDDTLTTVLEFVGNKSYRSFGRINKHCKEIYLITKGMTKETFFFGYGRLSFITNEIERSGRLYHKKLHEGVGKGVVFYNRSDVMKWVLEVQNKHVLKGICKIAAEEGRLDILNEVWTHIEDEGAKRYAFGYVDVYAAENGKLNVLKWLEEKGKDINKAWCAREAAKNGHLHIIQWLKEEKGFELDGYLYNDAILGGQLHVMKWLREQKVPWTNYTFANAAEKGNLNILQWLHDEGCPWPENNNYLRVYEDKVKPEVIDWLRSNDYANRIKS